MKPDSPDEAAPRRLDPRTLLLLPFRVGWGSLILALPAVLGWSRGEGFNPGLLTFGLALFLIVSIASGLLGWLTFTYQVRDNLGALSVPALVTLTVRPNLAPVVANDTATTSAGAPVTINVLANDADPEGNAMTVVNLTQPAAGSGTASTNGTTVTYAPPASLNAPLTVTFTYQVQDAIGATSTTATVTVTVNPATAADTLAITTANAKTGNNGRASWDIQGTTSRPQGNQIRIEVTTTRGVVQLGTATPAGNGRWRLSVNNSTTFIPSATPSATVRSTFGGVSTAPISLR